MRKQSDDLRRAADILSVPPDQVVSAAERLVAEWKELRKLTQRTTNEQAAAKTREEIGTAKGAWPIVKDEVPQGVGFMMSMSKATASESRATGIYWAKAPNDVKLVVTRGKDVPIDAAELVRTVAPEFHGKGGGRAYGAEPVEKKRDTRTIARAMLARLSEEPREAFQFAAILSAIGHGIAPLIAGLLPILPFVFLDARTATVVAVAITLVILFLLGVYLGNLVRERVLVTGLRFAAAGIGTAAILWLLGARPV